MPVQINLLIIIALGFFLRRRGFLKKEDSRSLSKLLVDVMLPALILLTISNTDINARIGLMTLASVIVLTSLFFVGWLLSKIRGFNLSTHRTVVLLMGSYWGATLAYPFILGSYGQEGLKIFIFYDIVQAFLMSTFIPYFASGKSLTRKDVRSFFTNPLFLALVIGGTTKLIHLDLSFASELLKFISSGLVFIGLIVVGLNLEFQYFQWKKPILIIFIKILVGLLLSLLLSQIFNFASIDRSILILAATLPPSLMIVLFGERYDLDIKLASSTLTIALPISFALMSAIIWLT